MQYIRINVKSSITTDRPIYKPSPKHDNQDIIEGNIADSPSLNKYAYCQGNPVSQLDPFGLSPQSQSSMMGHFALDILGFVPVLGIIADIANGFWYLNEGDYFGAIASFIAAVPMVGDFFGGIFKSASKFPCLANKIIFGGRAIGALGGFALNLGMLYNISSDLANKHIANGEPWNAESTQELLMGLGNIAMALLSARNFGDNLNSLTGTQCFVAGTLVLTIDGNKPIEEIKAGDLVYSTDPETGESEYKEVVQTFENETEELVHVTVNGEEIITTPKHPFYVPQKGWTSAIDLKAGDILVLSNGEYVTVEKVQPEILESPVKVYNFEVKDFHTYYVGENSVLVHNVCDNVQGGGHGSKHHKETINDKMNDMAVNGFIDSNGSIQDYDAIYGNRALSTVGLNGSQRPDIITVKQNGNMTIYDIYEYASPSQYTGSKKYLELRNKIKDMKLQNPPTSNTRFNFYLIDWGSY